MDLNDFCNNFIKLSQNEVILHDIIPDDDIFIYIFDSTCNIYNLKDIFINNQFKQRFFYDTSIKVTTYTTSPLRFSKYYHDVIMYPFLQWDNINRTDNSFHEFVYLFNDYNKASFIGKLEKIDNKYYIVYYANKKLLQRIILNKKSDYKTQTFIDILYNNIKNDTINSCEKSLYSILHTVPQNDVNINDLNDVNGKLQVYLKDNITLYDYQTEDIKWMGEVKNKIDTNDNIITNTYNTFNNVILNGNEYLLYNRTLIPGLNSQNVVKTINLKYYGGNIISEVGLGKTLVVLCHILMNNNLNNLNNDDIDLNNFVDFENEKCNYFFKRGKNKGSSCIKNKDKNDELYCREHCKTLFIDKRNTIFKNIDTFNLRDYIIDINSKDGTETKHYFKTNANLIICPNQLCDQWVREYYEKFKQDDNVAKRVLLVVTYDQYKNLTFGDILFADIIVISYNFLLNNNYYKKLCLNNSYYRKNTRNIINLLDDLDTDETISSIDDILGKHHSQLNLFDNFYYNAVYIDESHEIVNTPRSELLNTIINACKSKYRWCISATPFSNGIKSMINNINYQTNYNIDYNDLSLLNKEFIDKLSILYRRNTKESIKNEYNGNIIVDNTILLDFTEQERTIYDAHVEGNIKTNRDFLVKLCCDTSIDVETRNLVKNCKTFDEIQSVILTHNKKKLVNLTKKIQTHKDDIDKLNIIVDRGFIIDELDEDGVVFETIEQIKVDISILKRKITNDKKEYDNINRTYQYLKNAVNNIKQVETCPICLDDIQPDQIAITKCGHKFCKECIHEFIDEMRGYNNTVKCPKCNIEISISDIFLLKDTVEHSCTTVENPVLNELIQKTKSTKIGNIIYYLKTQIKPHDKCIIFSQWDTMLKKIGKILNNEKIDVLYCSGTIYQRKIAIKSFQEESKSNIICLSSQNCASGINLTAANKIILIEPIYGTKDYRKDIENQAIGRADRLGQKRPIEIIRFIIKNSIEEDILNENNEQQTNHQTQYELDNNNLLENNNIITI